MPLEVPKSAAIRTTVYDNFKGVDFTNDPTNVWTHRSPDAKNMIPDLSGRPWKRTGWEIVKKVPDFIDCYNDTTGGSYEGTTITTVKTMYFELGGIDYIAIVNNLGLFFYSTFIDGADNLSSENPYLLYINKYYGEEGEADENTAYIRNIAPDANRGFFFEGQGKAGFYIFCTIGTGLSMETALFRFDGERLRRVEPYVPTIMFAKGAGDNGAGTLLDSPNILTLERIVLCSGDGSGTDFILPEQADLDRPFTVEVISNGTWYTKAPTTEYTATQYLDKGSGATVTKVSFTSPPSAPDVTGEDNIRITYSIFGTDISETTSTFTLYIGTGKRITQKRTLTYVDGNLSSTTSWIQSGTASNFRTNMRCYLPNAIINNGVPDIDVYLKSDETTWSGTKIPTDDVEITYDAYANTVVVYTNATSGAYSYETVEYSNPTELSSNVTVTTGGSGSSGEMHAMGSVTHTVTTVVQQRTVTTRTLFPCKVIGKKRTYASSPARNAFEQCSRATVYGDGLINSVFLTATTAEAYKSRVWWSEPTNPAYFPDTNYLEAGSNDTQVAGLMKVGEYLGIIKQGQSMDSTIYLAYSTKFPSGTTTTGNTTETVYDDTFAIKASIGGVGAISNGAFNILNDEPLFLSKNGVMGINPTNENEKQLRNRSFFINKKLLEEPNLERAFSFVWRNMYILAVNNHCYILDGSQKSSWANEKTNLQYEAYYWDNVPAQCFARYNEELWFTDHDGRLCRFKPDGVASSYHDDYDTTIGLATSDDLPFDFLYSNPDVTIDVDFSTFWNEVGATGQYVFTLGTAGYLHRTILGHDLGNSGHLDTTETIGEQSRSGDSIVEYMHDSEGWHINGEVCSLADYGITITSGTPKPNDAILVNVGNPVYARWTTVMDDDGAAYYFKNLQKKGTMVTLYPQSSTGVKVYIKKDNLDEQYIGTATVRSSASGVAVPSDFYLKKKAKKYKRLQIIAENNGFDETFGIDQIIKCYTVGNYSKGR